jgi:hypothetical protein
VPRTRSPLSLIDVVSALGGALVGLSLNMWGEDIAANVDGTTAALALLGVVGLAAAYAVLAFGSPLFRPAAIALLVVSGFSLASGLLHPTNYLSPGTAVLLVLIYGAAYFAPLSKGRPVLLGATLLAFWQLVVASFDAEVRADGTTSSSVPAVVLSLLLAVVFLAAALALDLRGLSGPATPFIVAGNVAALFAAAVMGVDVVAQFIVSESDPVVVPALMIMVVGLLLSLLGSLTSRRFTLWHGAFIVAAGALALVTAMFETSTSVAGPVFVLLIIAGCLLAIAPFVEGWQTALEKWIAPRLGSQVETEK